MFRSDEEGEAGKRGAKRNKRTTDRTEEGETGGGADRLLLDGKGRSEMGRRAWEEGANQWVCIRQLGADLWTLGVDPDP